MLRWTYLAAGILLLGLVSFVITSSAGEAVGILCSLGVGALSVLFVRLIDSYSAKALGELAPMVMSGLVVGLGALLKWLTAIHVGWGDAVGVLAAMGVAWGFEALLARGSAHRCFICKQAVESGSFACPRCQQITCARPTCWVARHFRCRYCDEREVIVFPIDDRWWRARLGPRVSAGACSSCYKEAGEADLRECRECGWPMCKRCWDYNNGQCTRCEWILPDLPSALTRFLGATRPPLPGQAQAKRRHS